MHWYFIVSITMGFASVIFLWFWSIAAVRLKGLKVEREDTLWLAALSVGCLVFSLAWPLTIVATVLLVIYAAFFVRPEYA